MTREIYRNRFMRPLAIVLGTNDIASPVALYLQRARRAVIMSHDPYPPVIRRAMAFHDVLYGAEKTIDGIKALRTDRVCDVAGILSQPNKIAITFMELTDLLTSSSMLGCKNIPRGPISAVSRG